MSCCSLGMCPTWYQFVFVSRLCFRWFRLRLFLFVFVASLVERYFSKTRPCLVDDFLFCDLSSLRLFIHFFMHMVHRMSLAHVVFIVNDTSDMVHAEFLG